MHFSRLLQFAPRVADVSAPVATVRSQSLGISYGTGKSIENALNTFKPDGDPAWDALDFAVFAARQWVKVGLAEQLYVGLTVRGRADTGFGLSSH